MDNLMKAKRILRANGIRYYADKHATKSGIHVSVKPGRYFEFNNHPKRDAIALFLSGLADRVSHPVCHLAGTDIPHGNRGHNCLGNTRYIFHI